MTKRFLPLLLALALLLTCLPMAASAEEETEKVVVNFSSFDGSANRQVLYGSLLDSG